MGSGYLAHAAPWGSKTGAAVVGGPGVVPSDLGVLYLAVVWLLVLPVFVEVTPLRVGIGSRLSFGQCGGGLLLFGRISSLGLSYGSSDIFGFLLRIPVLFSLFAYVYCVHVFSYI